MALHSYYKSAVKIYIIIFIRTTSLRGITKLCDRKGIKKNAFPGKHCSVSPADRDMAYSDTQNIPSLFGVRIKECFQLLRAEALPVL